MLFQFRETKAGVRLRLSFGRRGLVRWLACACVAAGELYLTFGCLKLTYAFSDKIQYLPVCASALVLCNICLLYTSDAADD